MKFFFSSFIKLNSLQFFSFLLGPSNWSDIGGSPESMWTPSVQSDDYWFRLQYDPETARFEDISALLLKPSSSESLNSCRICEHFSKQNAKSVLSCSGLELQPATTWSMKYVSSIQCLQKTEDSLDSYNDYTAPQNCIARRICCRFQMTCLHSRS